MQKRQVSNFKLLFNLCLITLFFTLLNACANFSINQYDTGSQDMNKSTHYGLVIHGGAGTITRKNLSPEKESALRAKLSEAIQAGYKTLNDGGSSIDAVSATIVILENSPLFNAGKGAVFTSEQTHELDASLMDGRDLNAGAITSVKNVKNPILLAEQVMLNSRHVMLSGKGAEEFAKQQNLELVENAYFSTDFRLQQLHKAKLREKQHNSSDHPMEFDDEILDEQSQDPEHKFGTVGAVAIDKNGNLAAGTSTGGMTNKRFGRIGDSPVIGAGTYADNRSCAVSATGHGEYFIRYAVAHDVCARVMHGKKSLQQAADEVIMQDLLKANGSGGIVAIDKNGNFVLTFNTEGMYRGYKFSDVNEKIQIYKM